ncbi:MAG: hypothetical protein KDI68_08575 [Gammaproteobacteria bacterium]|nr:hypothetical protein [Gammaproteobacteria bacterium]
MTVKPFFPVFIVLVGVVIYAYHAPEQRPESGVTATPKEYIELVEKQKAERVRERQEKRDAVTE